MCSISACVLPFVIFLLVPGPSTAQQSRFSNGQRRYANLYGYTNFNTTGTENLIDVVIGGLNFLRANEQFQENAQPDVTPKHRSKYDFIVIGAGTAGATIASRLSEIEDVSVLLIEAGPEETLLMDVPILANFLQGVESIDWMYETEPSEKYCRGMKGHKCKWPRGKVMGGSSALNYMIATRGNWRDYDRWAELGNDGWAFKDVMDYFKKLENVEIPELRKDEKHRGTNGPVSVDNPPFRSPMVDAFLEGGKELGYPLVDYNGEKQIGFSYIQSTMHRGYRMTSNRAYLVGKKRRNLHVTKMSMVHRILFDKQTKRAIGVLFVKNNRMYKIYADKEVILSAGAIGSPQLLMLSGIGPAEHLRELGIDVIRDARVGDNLMDHIAYGGLTFLLDQPMSITTFDLLNVLKPYLRDFLMDRKGPATTSGGCEGIAFVDVDDPKNRDGSPNMELLTLANSIHGIGMLYDNFGLDQEIRDKFSWIQNVYSWGVFPMILRPKSRGWLRLRSKDVNVHPKIVANYLSHPDDVRVLVKGIRMAIQVANTEAMRKMGLRFYNRTVSECEKYPFDSDSYWECNLRTETLTIYHYSGTCKMGPESDSTAVVDPTLKVIGIKGLRVADASIMPEIISAHPNIPIFMIAEKLSDMVKREWGYLND
ncbi:glucose dehydrogenase [FAD, quinone]-like [Ceratina calcarata]|uniref:Glucose dehydrogenase [FAD, quinone]-like n=1 Tax=Ceratina calcarata TaxID=156304 RepID=A0AAJ7SD56_9HYME|nr:glucose dehydrogenase [FAD, quinone]-like [Ceratina calcarata]